MGVAVLFSKQNFYTSGSGKKSHFFEGEGGYERLRIKICLFGELTS